MTPDESKLVNIFMEAQAKPEGRMFSENVLAGIKAVLAAQPAGPSDDGREGRAALMDRAIYHLMLTDICTLILGSAVPIGPILSRADYPPELAKAVKWLKDVQDREMLARSSATDRSEG